MDNYAILAGACLQWLRSQAWFREWMTVVVIALGSAAGFWLSEPDALSNGPRAFVLGCLEWAKSIALGTTGTSIAANLLVRAGANPTHPMIPVTRT